MKLLKSLGLLLVVVGLVVVASVIWELWGTDVVSNAENDRQISQVEQQWSQNSPDSQTKLTKNKTVLIKIPRFGPDYKWVVREGTETDILKRGPGHYIDSGVLGEPGNYAIAGHRTTYGAPFNKLDQLKKGDEIQLETWDSIYIYTVTGKSVVDPTDGFVLEATKDATITLTTCHPEFSSRERLIVKGTLKEILNK